MPEPFSIAFTTIGTTLGVLGFMFSTLSTINDRFTSIRDFRSRLTTSIGRLEGCQRDIGEWHALWSYESNLNDTEINERLWKTWAEFERIQNKREAVDMAGQALKSYVKRALRIGGQDWSELNLSKLSRGAALLVFLKSLRFAFFSEKTLKDKIDNLEKAIQNLKGSSESRRKELSGSDAPASVTPQVLIRLTDLGLFGDLVWKLRQELNTTLTHPEYALELRPLGWGGSTSVLDWQTLSAVHVRILIYVSGDIATGNPPPRHRVGLDYTLGRGPRRPIALDEVLGVITPPPNLNVNLNVNPKITRHELPIQRTKTFRDLLLSDDNLFAQTPVYLQWKTDLACLLVSLTNYSGLFWNTNWTINLCTSSIRFVCTESSGPSIHTLCSRGDHAPNVDPMLLANCSHGYLDQKLKNLGLVLAELICANPLRLAGANFRYERWEADSSSWVVTDIDEILKTVEVKALSGDVREAVGFCLEEVVSQGGTDGYAAFLHQFTAKVVKPIKVWADRVQDPNNKFTPPPNGFRRWPEDAFDDVTNPGGVNPVAQIQDAAIQETPATARAGPAVDVAKSSSSDTTPIDAKSKQDDKPIQQEELPSVRPSSPPFEPEPNFISSSTKPIDQLLTGKAAAANNAIHNHTRSEEVILREIDSALTDSPKPAAVIEEPTAAENGSDSGDGGVMNGGVSRNAADSGFMRGDLTSSDSGSQHVTTSNTYVPGGWDDSWNSHDSPV